MFESLRGAKRRGNLVAYQYVARLLRFARNDNIGVLQRSRLSCQKIKEFIFDDFVKGPSYPLTVIPAKAGHVVTRSEASALTFSAIQSFQVVADHLDSGFHRSDDFLRSHHLWPFS